MNKRKTPWRDNIESLAVAVLVVATLQHFVIQTYRIPSGSMQPTLMGSPETGIHDRILVDKLSFHRRDPKRFEVVVFKYPLDRSKFFVKRICGMPGEQLQIDKGDLWVRANASEPWRNLRRPRGVMEVHWKSLIQGDEPGASIWEKTGGSGSIEAEARRLVVQGDAEVRLRRREVLDDFLDGYPAGMRGKVKVSPASRSNTVGDLRLAGRLRPEAGCSEIVIHLREGGRTYAFVIPGPAGSGSPRIRSDLGGELDAAGRAGAESVAVDAPALRAGRSLHFAVENLDDRLSLELDGRTVATLDVPPAEDQSAGITIEVRGGAELRGLQVQRDIYYTRLRNWKFEIPAGHYVMLGDNTQDSSDSREWRAWLGRWPGPGSEGALVRANDRPGENPVQGDSPRGRLEFIRDEWGELHVVPRSSLEEELPVTASLVPRELIAGRALAVFWPLSWTYRVWRPRWIR